MLLEAIERDLRLQAEVADPGEVYQNYWIEHVLPQKWETHWPVPTEGTADETPEQRRERLLHTLGNLTLTGMKLGVKLKNRPWNEKRPILQEHSKLYLSNGLIRYRRQWGDRAIVRRSRQLTEVLISVWPAPEEIV